MLFLLLSRETELGRGQRQTVVSGEAEEKASRQTQALRLGTGGMPSSKAPLWM